MSDPTQQTLDALNGTAVHLRHVRKARDATDRVGPRHFLHAGPPLELAAVPGPMRGAIIAGLLLEREAGSAAEAEAIIDRGEVSISPCHDAGAVGAMAGIITPNTPVVVAGTAGGVTTFSPLNEGIGGAMRYGSYDDVTLARLRWLGDVLAPALDEAVRRSDPLDLPALVAEGLRRGDDCHNRLVATTAALLVALTPGLLRTRLDREDLAKVVAFIAGNGHFALPFAISAAKAVTLAASGVPGSPVVTAMASNGREFGIRVSGLGDRWFTVAAPVGDPVLVEGATLDDVTPTMGDSMIAETAGFGAFAMTAAPAIMSFVGGDAARAHEITRRMRTVCAGTSERFLIPGEDFRGTPLGIDVHKVRATGVEPVINNGLAHREPGRGRAGAGITPIPVEPFAAASRALEEAGHAGRAAAVEGAHA
ncbi:hypothetical protein Skr01_67750 [Sphaerisporangium krabiense]|uniref:DUF1116 domain-containing protein n=1 Tax=Sphaerisporangium krabiense TaxID=763782 RepID=A0A7W8Z3S9_9ACTN|nr:DUF1116 domain-containing protein [Sphaerisporangium krabiense]MBB5626891.1 hypothetical protein [Sphaerisporangium krabiense]GII66690.1 hypothetical protein Skr01_67750 [Sphaerisporangium krabiense]